jgi:EmrB/QacA subfamily drug resistance transporter
MSTVSEGRVAPRAVLIAACVSTLIVNANTSAVAILLPAISEDVNSSVAQLQWAVTGYSLVGASVIVTTGALGYVFGRRKVFVAGLILFIASCVFIALATNGPMVIAGRMIQGAAGSTLLACGLSLLSVASSGNSQMRAVSLWGAASAVGAAVGPLVGGLLAESTGWQGLFWIDAAIAVALVPLVLARVAESSDPNRSRSIDFAGSALVALVLAPVILALSEGSQWGWGSPATLGCFAISIASAIGFVLVEQRVKAPLVDLRLLRNKILIGATMAILIGAGTINGLMYVISLYFQDPHGLDMDAFQAGLATLPATVGLVALTPVVPRLALRYGSRAVIALGFAVSTVAFLLMGFVSADWGYGTFVLPIIGMAAGMALSNNPASSVATASVDESEVGAASGISNMARYIGAAVMTAAVATLYNNAAEAGGSDGIATGVAHSAILLCVLSAAGIALALLVARHRPPAADLAQVASATASHSHTIPVLSPAPAPPEPEAAVS